MSGLEQSIQYSQETGQALSNALFAFWGFVFLIALGCSIWAYTDAHARGKSGFAAATLVLLSGSFGLFAIPMVVCAWILVRPPKLAQSVAPLARELPNSLPGDIEAGPNANEYLERL